jgi:hypothetical protein
MIEFPVAMAIPDLKASARLEESAVRISAV